MTTMEMIWEGSPKNLGDYFILLSIYLLVFIFQINIDAIVCKPG